MKQENQKSNPMEVNQMSGKTGLFGYFLSFAGIIVITLIFAGCMIYGVPVIQRIALWGISDQSTNTPALSDAEAADLVAKLEKEQSKIKGKFESLTPKTPFIIINTTQNEYRLFKDRILFHKGFCSTGSYTKLYTEKKTWVFKTPKGVRKVISKITDPVWVKPDWAFVEEGLPIPPARHPSRYESGTLGDYALSLGDGYLIHGTLYQRFLGQSVTHGCVRMGDEDLELVYKTLLNGSKVYIY